MTHSDLVFKAYFHNYFMSCYKQKSSLIYRNLKDFTCLPKEHGQTGWEGVIANRNRSQGFTKYFSFHCLSSFGGGFTVVFTFFLFLKQVYAHADSIYLSAIKLPVITLRIIKYLLQQEEPSKRPPDKK